jgi:LysR family transcriptional regulator of gallate degradation
MSHPENTIELPHIRDLKITQQIYKHRRIGLAAEVVHMSQPAASQGLARIENKLGVALFERSPWGMVPSYSGRHFQGRLERIFDHLGDGEREARRVAMRNKDTPHRREFHCFCTPVHIRALLAIANAGSYSQAAADLGVKQPGVHRAARDLTALAGFEMFKQIRGGVVLTAAAEVFARHIRLAISEYRQAIYEINELLGRDVTTINIGSLPLSRAAILPGAIHRLIRNEGPSVQVNCVDARYDALLRDLRFGRLDFLVGALRSPIPADDIEQEELFKDRLSLIAAPGHPLAQRSQITLQDTLDYPWVAPPRSTPSGAYLFETLRIHELANTPVRAVSSSLVLLRGLMAQGQYISIASTRQVQADEAMGALARLPIHLPDSERPIGLTFRKNWAATPVQKRFLNIIRQMAVASENTHL